jgi:hypothetical protein
VGAQTPQIGANKLSSSGTSLWLGHRVRSVERCPPEFDFQLGRAERVYVCRSDNLILI